MAVQENKSILRKQYRKERADRFMNESWLHILSANEINDVTNIGSYISYEFEPDTTELNKRLIGAGKKLFLPRMLQDKDLEWVAWDGSTESLKKSGKTLEPIGQADSKTHLQVIIVPALHVDRSGNRLGQGGGSYDRALARSNAWKIALLHRGELTSENLPVEPHDQKVNAVATPEIIVRF
ncbi:MAG: 5-formyltetrahydrofolate cyclo-ligase [Candidatus Nanopelagicus sp.]